MKYRFKLLIVASVFLCLVLAQTAPASYTNITLYLDGVEVNDANYGDLLPNNMANPFLTIGSVGNKEKDYFYNEYIGAMDEFAIYNGLLSASRIRAHYDANDSNTAYTAAVQADNPLLWLRFEDASVASGATAENSGISVTDGEYNVLSVSPFGQVAGINAGSNALDFPDSGADAAGRAVYVDDNGEFSSGIDGILTVELWVKYALDVCSPPDGGDWARFYISRRADYGLLITASTTDPTVDPNKVVFYPGYAGQPCPYDLNDNTWHHLVVTYESVPTPRIPKDTNSYFEEVNENNPVLWLRFEDEEPKDYSAYADDRWVGYGTAATIVDSVGGIGKSVKLSGAEGQNIYGVAATNNANEPPFDDVNNTYAVYGDQYAFAPNDITFELWYKTFPVGQPQSASFAYFFQQHGAWDSGFYDVNNERIAPAVGVNGGAFRISGGSGMGDSGVNVKFDTEWHHLVVTYDEEYEGNPNQLYAQLYLDGEYRDDALFTITDGEPNIPRLGPEMSHILLGAENDMGETYNYFAGYMDEFAIYEGILDANSIEDHYWAWQPKNCTEMQARGYGRPADLNGDCMINFADIAGFASEWRFCNDPCDPNCQPNW